MKLLILLILIIFICGCTLFQSQPEENESISLTSDVVISSCESLCRSALNSGEYLESGPCLSDAKSNWEPNWNVNNWVCDIAHYPRQPIDNLQENQCQGFKEGKAQHFVELYPNCTLIRAV
jgi:hypothetical protein